MILETKRLVLRLWKKEDANVLYELARDVHVGPPCGWEPHKSLRESKGILRDVLINDYTYAIVLRETNEVIGNISLMPYCESRFAQNEKQAEIGFWLGYPYWGKGYMPEACIRLIGYGFQEKGLEKIWCSHDLENHNSMRVQQKCGFKFHHEDSYYSRDLDKKISMRVNCIENSLD